MAKRLLSDGYADVIIGLQHGDEGKGRIVDGLTKNYDWVARFNGGPNAGHTVQADGHTLALHQLPSGVIHPEKRLYIGAHCVVNPEKLCSEIAEVEAIGLTVRPRLRISAQASVIQPSHVIEDRQTMGAIGTTANGIGPAYADQAIRRDQQGQRDIRMGDFLHHAPWALEQIRRRLVESTERYGVHVLGLSSEAVAGDGLLVARTTDQIMERLAACMEQLKGCIDIDPLLLQREIRRGCKVLLEGAQAFGLDRTFGATPNVTSSNTGVAAAFLSTGIPVDFKGKAYGVAKLIPSRVGFGPFPSEFGGATSETYCMRDGGSKVTRQQESANFGHEIDDFLASEDPLKVGMALRMIGGEYGATTGRPRRLGAFDTVQVGSAALQNGLDGVFLTKADSLRDFSRTQNRTIPLCTGYDLDGTEIDFVPGNDRDLRRVVPITEEWPSFAEDIRNAREQRDLPPELLALLHHIQTKIACAVLAIGVGPEREEVVQL